MTRRSSGLVSSAFYVTLIILFSKAIGLIREMIMAAVFGANSITDAYNSAYSLFYIPVLLFSSCIIIGLFVTPSDSVLFQRMLSSPG